MLLLQLLVLRSLLLLLLRLRSLLLLVLSLLLRLQQCRLLRTVAARAAG